MAPLWWCVLGLLLMVPGCAVAPKSGSEPLEQAMQEKRAQEIVPGLYRRKAAATAAYEEHDYNAAALEEGAAGPVRLYDRIDSGEFIFFIDEDPLLGGDWAYRRARLKAAAARRRIARYLSPLDATTVSLIAQQLATGKPICGDTCKMSHAICESASVICEISEQYPGAADLASDCVWAQIECAGARSLCSRCEVAP